MVLVGRLRATDALGERRHSELLSLELELESKNISCFLGWPTVDGEDVGLPEDPEDILCNMTLRVAPVTLRDNTADPMSLRCNSVQAASSFPDGIGVPQSLQIRLEPCQGGA